MRARWANGLAGGLAVATTAIGVVALLSGEGGCELVVGDTVPLFTCLADAADTCPSGSVCVPATHECVPRSGTCTPGAANGCAGGMRCDAQTLRCGPPAPTALDAAGDEDGPQAPSLDSGPDSGDVTVGDARERDAPTGDGPDVNVPDANPDAPTCRGVTCSCSRQGDCDSMICADSFTQTPALYAVVGMSFCTQPCCTSADCTANTVCFATGGGANYCVLPKWIGRGGGLGTGLGGATCTGGADCRSGLCNMGTCADTCCSTAQEATECASGTVCRFAAFPGSGFDTHETAWCGAKIGNLAGGAICAVDSICQSGKCGVGQCEAVCRTTSDCGGTLACSYGAAPAVPTNKDIVAGCVTATGTTANGGNCTANSDCQSAFCDGAHCTDACVTDADCKSGMHCRPVVVQVQGSYSVLACES
jgi:hypothetical protein